MGAGAVGSYYGGVFKRNGIDVTLINRGKHHEAIINNGLNIRSFWGDYNIDVNASNKTSNLGSKSITLPRINDDSELTLGDLPSRIFVSMLDVGTVEKDASEDGWNDAAKRNADPAKIHAQSMMRYNQLHTQVVDITIPMNTNLSAGNLIKCSFPQISNTKRKEPDRETSGLYMIKELAHYFDSQGSFTKLKVIRDTFGKK